ncbi:uncharacterized protein LOC128552998 [Mercenaria mercenaria]|uniref:uncharacterized protein LOC128552998 n=1 Tax=Mercenaria mercenaria TaxID=6596 RepID=UPI00234E4865|nr:uncharacterized protein LOC128552998 [Mercenaria mercenaria]
MGVDIQTYRAKIGTFRHSCGVDVVTLVLVVNFSHGLKAVGSVLFIGLLLMMAGIEPNPGPIESGATQSTKIKVTGIPKRATAEFLILFFGNVNRQEGGKVKTVTIDNDGNSAIVEFEETEAVDRVMKQVPVKMLKTEVNIEIYVDTKTTRPTKIKVSGLQDSVTDDALITFFENEIQGCGTVKSVKMYSGKHCAVMEFEEAEAVEFILQNHTLKINGTEVSLEAMTHGTDEITDKLNAIKVSGLPEEAIDEDVILMYFENEEKYGGKVKEICINEDECSAIIEFEEENAVENILKNLPITVLDTEVHVERFTHETDEITDKLNAIKVSGLPEEAIDEDVILMYFENEEKYGGKVKEICINEDECSAIIEFEEENAVNIILKNLPITVLDTEVHVERIKVPLHTSTKLKHTKPSVNEFTETVTEEGLKMCYENEERRGNDAVKDFSLKKNKRCAVVKLEDPAELSSAEFCIDEPKQKSVKDLVTGFSKVIEEMSSTDRTVSLKYQMDRIHEEKGDDPTLSRPIITELQSFVSEDSSHTTGVIPLIAEANFPSARSRKPEKPPVPAKKPRYIPSTPRFKSDLGNTDGRRYTPQFMNKSDIELSTYSQQQDIKTTHEDSNDSDPGLEHVENRTDTIRTELTHSKYSHPPVLKQVDSVEKLNHPLTENTKPSDLRKPTK